MPELISFPKIQPIFQREINKMSHINLPRPLDQVSEDAVEITQIVKSAGGNISRDTAKAESFSNLNSLTSGPNLGLDERQRGIKDRNEDSSKENEMAEDDEQSQPQQKSKGSFPKNK